MSDALVLDIAEDSGRLRQLVVRRALDDTFGLVNDNDAGWAECNDRGFEERLKRGPAGHLGLFVEGSAAEGGQVGVQHNKVVTAQFA